MAIFETLEDRQKAIVLTAYAYWLKGDAMQYDSVLLTDLQAEHGGNKRQNCYIAPEASTTHHTIYTVCSSFAYEVYREALGYELMGAFIENRTSNYFHNAPQSITVFKYDRRTSSITMDEALEKLKSLLEPGDAIVGLKENSGHIMLYCGDIDGDGVPKIIHSSAKSAFGGGKFSMDTGIDKIEIGGDICKDDAIGFLFENRGKGKSYYLGSKSRIGFILLRPLMGEAGRLPLTPSARGRLRYPMLRIDRIADCGYYGSVPEGGQLTYSVTVGNHSKTDYSHIPIMEVIPEGTVLCRAEDAVVCGRNLFWSLNLKAGEEKTVSYTVTATAPRGYVIVSEGGSVSTIPSNILCNKVQGKLLDTKRFVENSVWRSVVEAENPIGLGFAESVYRNALGLKLELPPDEELFASLFTRDPETTVAVYRPNVRKNRWNQLLVQDYLGGKKIVVHNSNLRVLNLRPEDLSPGDVIFYADNIAKEMVSGVWVYTGKELLGLAEGKLVQIPQTEMVKLLMRDMFLALRPAQAFDF